ncbi:hypothetical protein KY290_016615 [Solanum tuberosum]|uniref:Uncharacterized protein n=1 Tax=Solanum tuberosum TaxID=4113 RepID=A0ABQ7V8Z7_SOLTU|nr:hypothetical protein KY284_015892 [Solanum tuberosum]KAH0760542.1 hypothetical protein KY290_016615 [Solanum tuberosum]
MNSLLIEEEISSIPKASNTTATELDLTPELWIFEQRVGCLQSTSHPLGCGPSPNPTNVGCFEVSGLPTSLKQERRAASSPVAMGESSSSGTSRLETDSFKGI